MIFRFLRKQRPFSSAEFIHRLGFKSQPPWSVHFEWSTVNPAHWVTKRKVTKPDDLMLRLTATENDWVLQLNPKSSHFSVQWRASGTSVEAAELRYRKIIPWPEVLSPFDVPASTEKLEAALGVRFVEQVNMQGSLADEALSESFSSERLDRWLAPRDWSVFGHRS